MTKQEELDKMFKTFILEGNYPATLRSVMIELLKKKDYKSLLEYSLMYSRDRSIDHILTHKKHITTSLNWYIDNGLVIELMQLIRRLPKIINLAADKSEENMDTIIEFTVSTGEFLALDNDDKKRALELLERDKINRQFENDEGTGVLELDEFV